MDCLRHDIQIMIYTVSLMTIFLGMQFVIGLFGRNYALFAEFDNPSLIGLLLAGLGLMMTCIGFLIGRLFNDRLVQRDGSRSV